MLAFDRLGLEEVMSHHYHVLAVNGLLDDFRPILKCHMSNRDRVSLDYVQEIVSSSATYVHK